MKHLAIIIYLTIFANTITAQTPEVKRYDGKYALSEHDTSIISDYYCAIYDFENEYAKVRQGAKFGVINQKGEVILKVKHTTKEIDSVFLAYVVKKKLNQPSIYEKNGDNLFIEEELKAIAYYGKAIEQYLENMNNNSKKRGAKYIESYENTVKLYIKIGDKLFNKNHTEAILYYSKALTLDTLNSMLYLQIVDKLFNNDTSRTVEYYMQVLELDSNSMQAGNVYAKLATNYLSVKYFTKAEEAANKALHIDPSLKLAKLSLAHSLLFQGKYNQAKLIYLKWKDEIMEDTETGKQITISQLAAFEAEDVTHPDVEKIRMLLK